MSSTVIMPSPSTKQITYSLLFIITATLPVAVELVFTNTVSFSP